MRKSVSLLVGNGVYLVQYLPFRDTRECSYFSPAMIEPLCIYLCERRHSEGHLQGVFKEIERLLANSFGGGYLMESCI